MLPISTKNRTTINISITDRLNSLFQVGGFDTSIKGWGKEDVDLFDKFVAISENVTIFRAADPGLVHVFHMVECDPNLTDTQLEMCKNTRATTFGSQEHLAQLFCKRKDKYLAFLKSRNGSGNK